ncbi:hypothetical protein G6F46_007471 [Rhizopus delemar]|uniref:SigF-like NTF2-like domain-containing protein n=2 Tax=Rhizopus TaxID=4842 RepID=A0A9P6Z0U2_9FUNG|nr:hypothetical protein G6F55_006199 [Rhizopus delemar]KAG1543602.1 hypothetical protein G6F51_006574 [Rhizopus arrhizus]KAG1495853.1 hypothetical protein G6F54_006890 [Rhizopus delemar]KAG1516442.1 hypothetical protein G6F53_002155 [Rhizopus delemar]KAG1521966.1 hypothetical protein G6F52_006268 [Rhizopus delemar]
MSVSEFQQEISSTNLIRSIVEDLFSYDMIRRKRILEYYFFQDSTYTSPIMSAEGVNNIQYVYTVWQTLNRTEPTITNIVFDGQTAVIHLTHNLSPSVLPKFMSLQIPAITTLYFRETECDSGLLKIYRQDDSWTLEGLVQSVPLISFWYNNVLRVVMGKLMTTTGDILDSALTHAQKITLRSKEIQRLGHEMAIERLEGYRSDDCMEGLKALRECYTEPDFYNEDDYMITPIRETGRGLSLQDHAYSIDDEVIE